MKVFNRTRTKIFNDEIKIINLKKKTVAISSITTGATNHKTSFFALKNDYKKALKESNKDVFKAIGKIKNRYQCYDKKFWDAVNRYGFYGPGYDTDPLEMIYDNNNTVDPLIAIEMPDFDEDALGYFYNDAYLMYTVESGKNPLSLPYYIDYIGGVTNDEFNLDQAMKQLEANEYVFDIKSIEIPYYNADEYKNRAIEFRVKLPQDTYTKLCKYYRDTLKHEHWTCRVKEAMVWKDYYEKEKIDLDFLGLKQYYTRREYSI